MNPTTHQDDGPPPELIVHPYTMSRRKKLAFSAILFFVLLGALELTCRALGWGGPDTVSHVFSDWHHTPDGRVFWVVHGPGYNADGMKDREHAIEKPSGVTRVVCLGDSVTEGWGAPRSQRYPVLLESFFKQMGLNVEVLVVAAAGWSTLQEVAAYEQIARKYKPDYVFLGFCLNDVAEMNNNLNQPPRRAIAWLVRRSAFVRTLIRARSREVRQVRDLFAEDPTPAVTNGWNRVLAHIDRLAGEVRADGAQLSVLVFPFRTQLSDPRSPPPPQKRMTRHCWKRHIPALDLLPAIRAVGNDAFIDESHFSAAGARAVAADVVRWGRTGCALCGLDLSQVTAPRCPRCHTLIER